MKKIYYLVIASTIIALSGCFTTGGTFEGLPLPKFLTGKVENSIYYAKGGSFSIQTPFPQGSYDYKYMAVKEQYHPNDIYVSFNTSTAPDEFYRVEVADFASAGKSLPALEAVADQYAPVYEKQLMAGNRGAQLTLVKEEPWSTSKASGVLRLYTTVIPASVVVSGGAQSSYTAYHLLYFTEGNGKLAIVDASWIPQLQEFSPPPQEKTSPQEANQEANPIMIALAKNGRARAFFNSIDLSPTTLKAY